MKTNAGDRFSVSVADSSVLMEARSVRCGDVWDCYPVDESDPALGYGKYASGAFAQDYGSPMVFTDEQVAKKAAFLKEYYG